jgi:lipooligosaccharide transport system ATP-binding protein
MNEPIIKVEHIHKSYGTLKAVDDLSFSVPPSKCFGFLGPNGAGKTTLMHMMYGQCEREHRPETKVDVFGFDPLRQELDIKFLSGVVPQDNNLDDELNVTQNLRVYANFYGMEKKEARERIDSLLDFLELGEKRKAKLRELSGGMKRRLVIARALLHEPKLLILDEPTTGLDPQVRHVIWTKLRQLKEEGLTILLTTHYMEEAFQLCDTILIMDKSRKVIEGDPQALMNEHVERWVLEVRNSSAADVSVPEGVRRDGSDDHPVFYSNDSEALKRMEHGLPSGTAFVRQTNLEDLFLKMTGRALNEQS